MGVGASEWFLYSSVLGNLSWMLPLPEVWLPVHGLLLGVVLAPALRLWIWVYTELFYIGGNHELTPSLGGMFIMPASGALCGAIIFALAHRLDFQVLHPVHEESLRHAD